MIVKCTQAGGCEHGSSWSWHTHTHAQLLPQSSELPNTLVDIPEDEIPWCVWWCAVRGVLNVRNDCLSRSDPGDCAVMLQRGWCPHFNSFIKPLLFSTFASFEYFAVQIWGFDNLANFVPPYLTCARIRKWHGAIVRLKWKHFARSLASVWISRSCWNEATGSEWQHSETKGFIRSNDGVPAANQTTLTANESLWEQENRSGGKFGLL